MDKALICGLCLLTALTITAPASSAMLEKATLNLYMDGSAHFQCQITAEESEAAITLPLLAHQNQIYNILVLDEYNSPVSYELEEWNITMHSLGATSITLEYETNQLTTMEEGLWTLTLNTPFEITVILPENSTVMYINQPPLSTTTQQDKVQITLSPGQWEISYTESQKQQEKQADLKPYIIIAAAAAAIILAITALTLYRRHKAKSKSLEA